MFQGKAKAYSWTNFIHHDKNETVLNSRRNLKLKTQLKQLLVSLVLTCRGVGDFPSKSVEIFWRQSYP
jgi:hypothetical protein